MSRVEDALMRLYESADLRDELTDDEADKLLKWAEAELARLDASGADDAAFEAQTDTLMKLLKQMNRYAGRQGQGFATQSLSAQGADEAPGKIAGLASELGHTPDAVQIAAAATGDPASTIEALTALMTPSPNPPTPMPPDPTTQPPEPASQTPTDTAPTGAQTYAWETNADDDYPPSDEA